MPRPRRPATSCAHAPNSTRSMWTSPRRARWSPSTTCASPRCAARPRLRHPPSPPSAPAWTASSVRSMRHWRAAPRPSRTRGRRPGPRAGGLGRRVRGRLRARAARGDRRRGRRRAPARAPARGRARERVARPRRPTALGRALDVRNAAAELVARGRTGIRGLLGDAIKVTPGYEAAIAAVLGPLAEGVLVDTRDDAFAVARTVRGGDLGVVDIAIAAGRRRPRPRFRRLPGIVAGARRRHRAGRACSASCRTSSSPTISERPRRPRPALADAALGGRSRSSPAPVRCTPQHTLRVGIGSGPLAPRAGGRARRRRRAPRRDRRHRRLAARSARGRACTRSRQLAQRTKAALSTLRAHDAALAAHTEKVNRATVRHEAAIAECDRLAAGARAGSAAVDEAEAAARSPTDAAQHRARGAAADARRVGARRACSPSSKRRARRDARAARRRDAQGAGARRRGARRPARAAARTRAGCRCRGRASRGHPARSARGRGTRRRAAARACSTRSTGR